MKITKDRLIKIIKEEAAAVIEDITPLGEIGFGGYDIEVGNERMAEVILQMVRGYAMGTPPAEVDMAPEALGQLATSIAKNLGVSDDGTGQVTQAVADMDMEQDGDLP